MPDTSPTPLARQNLGGGGTNSTNPSTGSLPKPSSPPTSPVKPTSLQSGPTLASAPVTPVLPKPNVAGLPKPPIGATGGPVSAPNSSGPTITTNSPTPPPLSAPPLTNPSVKVNPPTQSFAAPGMPNTGLNAAKPAAQPTLTPSPAPLPGQNISSPPPSPNLTAPKPSTSLGGVPPVTSSKPGNVIKKSPFRLVGPLLIILAVLGLGWFAVSRFLGGRQNAATQDITLTYWGLWESNQTMKAVFSAFESSHPGVKINYVMQSHKDYRERLQAAINRGEGPDLFRFHNTWAPMLKNELSPIPKSIYTASEFETTFFPVAQKDLKIGSNYVGIPLEFDGLALYYNQTVFQNANKTPPTTWEELRALASQLTLRDDEKHIIRGGIALGTTGNVDHWSDILGLMMLQNAANPASPKGQLAEDSLAFYTIFSKTDNVWDETLPSSTVAFAGEKAVMMIAPSWRAFDVLELNPNLKFATVPVPQLPNTSVYWASYWAEGVSKKSSSEKQAVAWELLKFLSQPDNIQAFYTAASQTRLFGEPYPRVDMVSQLAADPVVGAYVSTAKNAQSWYLSGWTHDNGLNDRIIKYYEDAVNAVVNKGASPKKALEATAEGVVQVLSQFGVSGALR